jgi:hypothetical protein
VSSPERPLSALLEPVGELRDRDQSASAAAHDTQLVRDMLLEEVGANAERLRRLGFGQCEPCPWLDST